MVHICINTIIQDRKCQKNLTHAANIFPLTSAAETQGSSIITRSFNIGQEISNILKKTGKAFKRVTYTFELSKVYRN